MGLMDPIVIKINHDPVPWSSPKLGRGLCYSAHSKFKEIFHAFICSQYKEPPLKGYVDLELLFICPYPKSASKKNLELMKQEKLFPTKSDLTNLQKFAEDCLKKIVIEDDRNVVQISSKKIYGLHGCVNIKVVPHENNC